MNVMHLSNLRLITSRMLLAVRCGTVVAVFVPCALVGQLQMLTNDSPTVVFGGGQRRLNLHVRNSTDQPSEADVSFQLVQASSSLATPRGAFEPWKKLRVLPGQTVVESAVVTIPEVRAATRFLVLWSDADRRRLGTTEVEAYPATLLSELRPLAGGKPVGVFDPLNQLKPLLRELKIETEDLEKRDLEFFDGPLAILGPFASAGQMPFNLANSVRERAQAGTAIVWIQPPAGPDEPRADQPKNYLFGAGRSAVFVAHSDAIAGLDQNPQAQLNLVRFARLALKVDHLELPKPKL